jgi:hypothetical protein
MYMKPYNFKNSDHVRTIYVLMLKVIIMICVLFCLGLAFLSLSFMWLTSDLAHRKMLNHIITTCLTHVMLFTRI